MADGRIVILNGVPRSGKSSMIAAMQKSGSWLNLGVDHFMSILPAELQPGVGLRPGGELPELEPVVAKLYRAMFESVAAHSRQGFDVAVDVGLHDDYTQPIGAWEIAHEVLSRLPTWWVGVHCSVEVLMQRRKATGWSFDDEARMRVEKWITAVHGGRAYDVEVDTSEVSPEEAVESIFVYQP